MFQKKRKKEHVNLKLILQQKLNSVGRFKNLAVKTFRCLYLGN